MSMVNLYADVAAAEALISVSSSVSTLSSHRRTT